MKPYELIFMVFCGIGAFNALFLSVYILLQRDKIRIPSLILSVFMVFTAFRITRLLLTDFQDDFDLNLELPLFYYAISASSLVGPMLFLFLKYISNNNLKFKLSELLHFLPFILIFLGQYSLAHSSKYDFNVYLGKHLFVLIQFLIYILLSYWLYVKTRVGQKMSDIPGEPANDIPVTQILIIFSFLWILDLLNIILIISSVQIYSFSYLNIFYSHSPEPFFYSILIYFMLYLELRSGKITNLSRKTAKYGKSALPFKEASRLKDFLIAYMDDNKSYRDSSLTLVTLARQINLAPHTLSQIINDQLKLNFNDFVNSYRVEEAKRLLGDRNMKNITIAGIAYDSGFNTISAFNVAFKKFTGLTPSQFRTNVTRGKAKNPPLQSYLTIN